MIPRPVLALFTLSCLLFCSACLIDTGKPETPVAGTEPEAVETQPEAHSQVVTPAQPRTPIQDETPARRQPEPSETEPADHEADAAAKALAAEIEVKVSRLRGLAIKSPTAVGAYTEDELRAYLGEKVGAALVPEVIDFYGRAMVLLNLYEPDVDIEATTMALLSEQVAGFYEPEAKQLFVVKRTGDAMAKMDRIVMAHELVHALQDQHFDLETMLGEITDNDDAVTARKSLIEGDATWAMLAFEQGIGMARIALPSLPDSLSAFMTLIERAKKMGLGGMIDTGTFSIDALATTPAVDADEMIFAYYGGAKFCLHLLEKAGDKKAVNLERLDAAFKNPPTSTEQVMHPEKYDVARDDPVAIRLPDLSSVLGSGWRELGQNTLGELRLRTLFTETAGLTAKAAKAAHEGWDGDRYALYAKDGSPDLLIWASIWDRPEDCQEFVAALMQNQGADPATIEVQQRSDEGLTAWTVTDRPGHSALLVAGGDRVFFVRGAANETLSTQLLKHLETETEWIETASSDEER